jgi:inner membrane transporter RhtA
MLSRWPDRLPFVMVLVALVSVQGGGVISVRLFDQIEPAGLVALRSFFAAAVLLGVTRPRLRGRSAAAWTSVGLLGITLACLNSLHYEAVNLIPVGPAVTLELLGPLGLYLVFARRWSALIWAVLAFSGVVLMQGLAVMGPNAVLGVFVALLDGVCWASYIVCSRWAGSMFKSVEALAIATAISALVTVPRGALIAGGALLEPKLVLAGAGIAMIANVIPNGLEMLSLKRIPGEIFSVMMAMAPVIASVLGFLILGQSLTWSTVVGMTLVVVATASASLVSPSNQGSTKT